MNKLKVMAFRKYIGMGRYDFNFGHNVPQPDYKTDDPPTYQHVNNECFGLLVCPHCGKAVMCNRVTYSDDQQETSTMINRTPSQAQGSTDGNKRRRNGLPFLSSAEASLSKQPGRIVAARVEDDTFKPGRQVVAMRIQFKGQDWLYNLRTNNPVLDSLCSDLGDDETRWANKDIMIYNEEDQFNAKLWLRFEAVTVHEDDEPEPVPVTRSKRGK